MKQGLEQLYLGCSTVKMVNRAKYNRAITSPLAELLALTSSTSPLSRVGYVRVIMGAK